MVEIKIRPFRDHETEQGDYSLITRLFNFISTGCPPKSSNHSQVFFEIVDFTDNLVIMEQRNDFACNGLLGIIFVKTAPTKCNKNVINALY